MHFGMLKQSIVVFFASLDFMNKTEAISKEGLEKDKLDKTKGFMIPRKL